MSATTKYNKISLLAWVLALFFGFQNVGYAQFDSEVYLRMYGTVVDSDNEKSLGECIVRVLQDGEYIESYETKKTGKYDLFLPSGPEYRFYFEKDGFVSKNILINTKDAGAIDDQFIYSLKADISLFKTVKGIDYTILEQPIGKGACNPRNGKVQFDKEYTKSMEEQIAMLYVPTKPNNSEVKRVTIEETIVEVPLDDDAEWTVEDIFKEAETANGLAVIEAAELEEIKEEEVSPEPEIELAEEIIEEESTTEGVQDSTPTKSITDEAIKPVKIVESDQFEDPTKNVIWRVQVGAYTKQDVDAYQGLVNVDFITDEDGITRCVAGYYEDPISAAKHKLELIEEGYTDAFLTAYINDQRVDIKEVGVDLSELSYTKLKEEMEK